MTREELIKSLTLLKEQAGSSGGNTFVWDIKIDSFNFVIDSASKALEQEPQECLPTVDAIPRERIEQMVTEIERKANSGQWSEATVYGMKKAVAIIHKYTKEQNNE